MVAVTVDFSLGSESLTGIKTDVSIPAESRTSPKVDASILFETSPLLQATPPKIEGFSGRAAIVGATVGPPPPSYTGPGDIAVPLIGYSVRALSSAKLGQPIFTLRSAGGGTQNINALASNGKADQASAASFLGANAGYLQSWIDQGPGGFDTRSLNVVDPNEFGYNPNPFPGENSQQPKYVASAIAGCPTFDPAQSTGGTGWTAGWTETQTGVAVPSSFTVFCVAKPRTNVSATNFCSWDVQDTSTPGSYFHVSVLRFSVRDESIDFITRWGDATGGTGTTDTWTGTSGVTAFSYFEATHTGTAGDPFVKNTNTFSAGTSSGTTIGGYTPPYPVVIWDFGSSVGPQMCEILIYPALSAPVRQQIRQNIGAFYGIAVAP